MNEAGRARRRLVQAGQEKRARVMSGLSDGEVRALDLDWPVWAHRGQEAPAGEDWRVWVMLGGRGFGKTRAGAEWVSALARTHPGCAIALVAANPDEARRVMIEGRSGLLAVARPSERDAMRWRPSQKRLTFASGAEAFVFSGAAADGLRGPEHHFAWCDELAKWRQAEDAWDNLMLGLRLGPCPRVLVTTTPRPIAALKAIIGDEETVRGGGATFANPHLAAAVKAGLRRRYGGTRTGRQELEGIWSETLEGALWWPQLIAECRAAMPVAREPVAAPVLPWLKRDPRQVPRTPAPAAVFERVVVGVDPPASPAGTCGIVVCGLAGELGYVLDDASVARLSPEGWAAAVAKAAARWGARQVIAEANNGGAMVATVLKGAGVAAPVRLVHAAEGKAARAAPVAALFECGRAKFVGAFPELEEQLCGLIQGGGYEGPGKSPDRADAMVWALTALMLEGRRAPRIVGL